MEEDGTEPRPGIIAEQGRRETPKTGEDGGGGRRPRQEKVEEDGTELQPGIIAGQGRRETVKTGEDGGRWYRTQNWHHSWTMEEGDGQDRIRWRRMVQNPDLAS